MAQKRSADLDPLALAKAVHTIVQKQDAFNKSVEDCSKLIHDGLSNLEMEATSKRRKIDELNVQYEQTKRTRVIELEQDLQEHGYKKALELLAQRKEIAVSEEKWNQVLTRGDELAETVKTIEQTTLARCQKEHAKALQDQQERLTLKHQAEIADHVANSKQLKNHISVLEKQVGTLQQDIEKQRQLTKDVAESARPQYHSLPYAGSK